MLKERGYRLTRDPVTNADGKIIEIAWNDLTDTDLLILLDCHEHNPTTPYLAAHTGCTLNHITERTKILKRPPNEYITLIPEQLRRPQRYQSDWQRFRLTRKGMDALLRNQAKGRVTIQPYFPGSSSTDHDAMVDEGILSLKIGLNGCDDIKLIDPLTIYEQMPEETKKHEEKWHYFPIQAEHTKRKTAHPDFFPLGFIRPFDEEGYYPFLVFEFETGANQIELSERDNSAVAHKILCWLDVIKERGNHPTTYEAHMGLPYLYPTFISYAEPHAKSVLDMIAKHVPPKYQSFFLVKVFRDGKWCQGNKKKGIPEKLPTGWMLTEDFRRVTSPFDLLTSKVG